MMVKQLKTLAIIFIIAFFFLPLLGCGSDDSSGGDEPGGENPGGEEPTTPGIVTEIRLTSGAPEQGIIADGESVVTIRSQVVDAEGNGVSGVAVLFTTSLGQFSNGTQTTTVNTAATGFAEARLTADDTIGVATIKANAAGFLKTLSIPFIAGEADGLALVALHSLLEPEGSTKLIAKITAKGIPLEGESLSFSFVKRESVGATVSPITKTTDKNGEVEVEYKAGTTHGDDVLEVRADSNAALNGQATVVVGGKVSLTPTPYNIPADGNSSSTLIATVQNNAGNPMPGISVLFKDLTGVENAVPADKKDFSGNGISDTPSFRHEGGLMTFTMTHRGTSNFVVWLHDKANSSARTLIKNTIGTVSGEESQKNVPAGEYYFSVTADGSWDIAVESEIGSGDTSSDVFDTLPSLGRDVTDENGQASYTYTSTTDAKTILLGCKAGNVIANSTIKQSAGSEASVLLRAVPQAVLPRSRSWLVASVRDTYNNPVAGVSVTFRRTRDESGGSFSDIAVKTDLDGEASVPYIAGGNSGTDQFSASAGSLSPAVTDVVVNGSALILGALEVSQGVQSLPADGSSQTFIRVLVKDAANSPEPVAGVGVKFVTSLGSLSDAEVVTDDNGIAQVFLEAPTTAGTALVRVAAGGLSDSLQVSFSPGPPSSLALVTDSLTVGPGESVTLQAVVQDVHNNAVVGERIAFSLESNNSGGSLANVTGTTDANGNVTVAYTAGGSAGTDTVKLYAVGNSNASDTASITVDANLQRIGSIDLAAGNLQMVADPAQSVTLRATVKDAQNMAVSGRSVAFTTTQGDFSSSGSNVKTISVATDVSGIAEVALYAPSKTSVANIWATVSGFTDEVAVRFIPGPPVDVNSSISAQPVSIPADGTSTAGITVTLADTNGNPVADGMDIFLSASMGTIVTNPVQTASGRATFTVRSADTAGESTLSLRDYPDIDSAKLIFGSIGSGIPSSVTIESVSQPKLSVTGVGQGDSTSVTVLVVDEGGLPIGDAAGDNVRVSFLAQPFGGELLSGKNSAGDTDTSATNGNILIPTEEGRANFTLRSGILPGAVELLVEVVENGNPLNPEVKAVIPQVSIASGPPHTIALSTPRRDAIINLNSSGDNGIPQTPGFYSQKGGMIVTDRYGNAVPDGTVVNLGVMDSVIASGKNLTGAGTAQGDATFTATAPADFLTDVVVRNGLDRHIQANDRVVLFDADAGDKSRFVSTAMINQRELEVTKPYQKTEANLSYAIGASLLGASIYGIQDGTATKGSLQTKNGLGEFRLVYPANANTIHVGGFAADPTLDTRHEPAGSARVILIATSSDDSATLVDEGTLAFSPIAPYVLKASSAAISSSANITLTLEESGDDIRIPFTYVSAAVNITQKDPASTLTVTAPDPAPTNESGQCFGNITIGGVPVSGDKATITYRVGDALVDVVYTAP